jgi:acyl-coenzyme A thioesterase PaaI-like protein
VDGATLAQPTLSHMCNTGGVLHGGYMMSFADSAVTRAAGMVTGMAPATVAFTAEFLSAGDIRAPLVARVEVPRHGKSLAFLRGILEQDGRKLLAYSATIRLRPKA